MAQSASEQQSRAYGSKPEEQRGLPGELECPKCHSDDVARSRRKFVERLFLPVVRAQTYRCRDCKHRFWVNVKWRPVILGVIMLIVGSGFVAAILAAHEASQAAETTAPKPERRYRARRSRLPRGLPPLSSIPRAADDPALAQPPSR
jgi:hypothetical protein